MNFIGSRLKYKYRIFIPATSITEIRKKPIKHNGPKNREEGIEFITL